MISKRYSPEFKEEVVRQVTERGYSVADVAAHIGVSTHRLVLFNSKMECIINKPLRGFAY